MTERVLQDTSLDAHFLVKPHVGRLQRLALEHIARGRMVPCDGCSQGADLAGLPPPAWEPPLCPSCNGFGRVHREGMTNQELVQATGIQFITIAPRVTELCGLGLVKDSGQRGLRKVGERKFSKSIIWVTTQAGKAAL